MKILKIKKFNKISHYKITFVSSSEAQNCESTGLLIESLHIFQKQIEKELFDITIICYRCYALDCHIATKCAKYSDFKICSKCSSHNHE